MAICVMTGYSVAMRSRSSIFSNTWLHCRLLHALFFEAKAHAGTPRAIFVLLTVDHATLQFVRRQVEDPQIEDKSFAFLEFLV
ncbi:MAG: hypothetical protein U5O39_12190 [Gammaproteobacteria bacterium]|nr:hypothetical protein [Gammaproteobacteria bacterium]